MVTPTVDISTGLPLALGTNTFGWTSDEAESFDVLDGFVEAGGRHIDTADSYSVWAEGHSGGESETIIGNWLAARGDREQVFLATKVGAHPAREGLARDNVEAALEDSLRRLRTDHVDLYYAHHEDESQSPEQLAETFDALVRAGRTRRIGISNLSPERQQAWIDHARSAGLALPVAVQPPYSLAHRSAVETEGYGELAARNDLRILAYFALASGLLSGKYRSAADIEGAARQGMVEQYATEDGFRLVETLIEVADARGDAPASVALAWVRAKGAVPIASARTTEQLPALLAGARIALSDEEVARLDEASAAFV